ncbi:PH domain-containing protein [Candidatus Saccharibacteria bacterium]|nr:PH domain-containing protein [Candidatus Saccharibacteria bacterium]
MKKELASIRSAKSAKQYTDVDLEKDEYVVLCLERSRIGIIGIWCCVGVIILVLCLTLIAVIGNGETIAALSYIKLNEQMLHGLRVLMFALFALIIAAGFIGQYIYNGNKMYITNMRVIQKIRNSLFSNSTNIIDLKRIEDVSYKQVSLTDHLFRFGTLRLSTVGEETTYTFPMLDTPRDEVKTISHLVHERKNSKKSTAEE